MASFSSYVVARNDTNVEIERDVRLIFAGKMLTPPIAKVCAIAPNSQFTLRAGSVVHAVITSKRRTMLPFISSTNNSGKYLLTNIK